MSRFGDLPPHGVVSDCGRGVGRAAVIRELWAQRCNVEEIRLALNVTRYEIARTLRIQIAWDSYPLFPKHRGLGMYRRTKKGVTFMHEREPSTDERLATLRARHGQLYDPARDRIDRDPRRCPRRLGPDDPNYRGSESFAGRPGVLCPNLVGVVAYAPQAETQAVGA